MPSLILAPPIALPQAPGPARRAMTGIAADPHAPLPLQGLTFLTVEDSRFAADALRLICQRSGARLRRADSLLAARSHLAVYRPDVVLVDLGLPDGRGEDLIADISRAAVRPTLVLAISGDVAGRDAALAAGADLFVEKPLPGLAAFQHLILHHLGAAPANLAEPQALPDADPVALQDDLLQAHALLAEARLPAAIGYVAAFVAGIARHAGDAPLADAAMRAQGGGAAIDDLARIVAERLGTPGHLPQGFRRAAPSGL